MNNVERILVDKEKVEIDGKSAYRLFFYDVMTGDTMSVISYITKDNIVVNRAPESEPYEESDERPALEEVHNAL